MRRALCVGIDAYPFGGLTGCVSDAERLATVLRKNEDGSPNFDIRELKAPAGSSPTVVTRSGLREAIDELFKHKSNVARCSFAGHGAQNNLGAYLVTHDGRPFDP